MPRPGMAATARQWLVDFGFIKPATPQRRLRAERTVPLTPAPERTPELSHDGDNSATSNDAPLAEPEPAVAVEHQVVVESAPVPAVTARPAPIPAPPAPIPVDTSQFDRRSRRRLGRIAVEHAETVLDREQLALAQDMEHAVDDQLAREDAHPDYTVPSRPFDRVWAWLSGNRVFLGVAALEIVGGIVVVLTQLGFYRDLTGLDIPLAGHVIKVWLAMPFVNEGFTWAYGAMATWAVHAKTGNAAKYVRRMWMSAAFTATVNIVHNVQHLGEPTTGVVVGLFSLALPGLWHSFVGMTSALVSGRSAEQIKAAVRARGLHPWISLRTDRIEGLLRCDRTTAWDLAVVVTVKEVRTELAKRRDDILDGLMPGATTVDDTKPVRARKRPAPKITPPPAEPNPDEQGPDAKVIDLELVRQFGDKSARAITIWLDSIKAGNELPYRQIDKMINANGTTKRAARRYIKEHGDPRLTAANA